MYFCRKGKMLEQSAERKIHIGVEENLHRRFRIRCAELDTTIQDFVMKLLDRELSTDRDAKCGDGSHKEKV